MHYQRVLKATVQTVLDADDYTDGRHSSRSASLDLLGRNLGYSRCAQVIRGPGHFQGMAPVCPVPASKVAQDEQ